MEMSGAPLIRFPVHPKKKSKHTASTSALFKKSTQPPDAKRKRDSRPTKYDLTSKPHGIRKRVLKNNALRTWQTVELDRAHLAQRNSSSSEFNEVTSGTRKSVLARAEGLLHDAQSSLLTRITNTYGTDDSPSKQKQQPTQPTKAAKPSKGPFLVSSEHDHDNDSDGDGDGADHHHHLHPTSSERCRAHNAIITRLAAPLASQVITYTTHPSYSSSTPTPPTAMPLGTLLTTFASSVAAEEQRIARLEAEWEGVQTEIRSLARAIVHGSLTEAQYRAGVPPHSGVDGALVEALRREARDVAEEFEEKAVETWEAEKTLKRRQERYLVETIRGLGQLGV